jgi:hypothetical protein
MAVAAIVKGWVKIENLYGEEDELWYTASEKLLGSSGDQMERTINDQRATIATTAKTEGLLGCCALAAVKRGMRILRRDAGRAFPANRLA